MLVQLLLALVNRLKSKGAVKPSPDSRRTRGGVSLETKNSKTEEQSLRALVTLDNVGILREIDLLVLHGHVPLAGCMLLKSFQPGRHLMASKSALDLQKREQKGQQPIQS